MLLAFDSTVESNLKKNKKRKVILMCLFLFKNIFQNVSKLFDVYIFTNPALANNLFLKLYIRTYQKKKFTCIPP